MDPPLLNYDVLLAILAQCESHQTGLRLMSTCRLLYQEGVKVLLRREVRLVTEKQLVSFLSFLLEESTGFERFERLQHVHALALKMYNLSFEVAELFVSVCPFLIGLKSLELSNVEWIFDERPNFIVAVAMLESLNHLTVSYWVGDSAMAKLLQLLRAPLRTLSVNWTSCQCVPDSFWETMREEHWPKFHPTLLLENFAETLEELTWAWWWTTGTYIPPPKTYPRMHRLVIDQVCGGATAFPLVPFIHAFPNLTHILVKPQCGDWNSFDEDGVVEAFRASHAQNVSQQLITSSNGGGAAWQHMEEFSGTFVDLYIFGLACHVHRLILHDDSCTEHFPFLAEVLSYTCPSYLDYKTSTDCWFDGLGFLSTGIREAGSSARSRLDTLIVRFTFNGSEPDTGFLCAMVRG
ncbi:hypothetical protein L226DRAFT_536626 [Lentinus tigrinus ALCF2SS1-7]|uniref:uncharacterized protein n=1 Tax=Lentinus tigrinus ALCF2SS1-7 TaxID=1328758 RepID=UPI001165F6F5|nr:hypothetical protein L226DRAFT_536626 [Lentinus tigrinus ALCF2SS1-7]